MSATPKWRALAQSNQTEALAAYREVYSRLLKPHSGGQVDVLRSTARFRVVEAGRRWGKTKIAARETVREAVMAPGSVLWWVSNRWRNTRRGYKAVCAQLPPSLLARPAPSETANELTLHLRNGTAIEFYSAESPDALVGEGVTFVVVDEAGLIRENVWTQHIRPTLMDTGGRAMLIGTPRGKNWFDLYWSRGQSARFPEYASWRFPQWMNPFIPAEETEAARRDLPALIFQQEIAAIPVSSAASIFGPGLERAGAVRSGLVQPSGLVVMGADFGKKEDWTVLTASNELTREPCYHERMNTISWPKQKRAIRDATQWLMAAGAEHVVVWADSTGLGDVLVDELEELGVDIEGIEFTTPWKLRAVKKLAADLEQGRAHILTEQKEEFESYEYTVSEAGRYTFHAARGHDDEVSAKLLEHWGLAQGMPDVQMVEFSDESDLEEHPEELVELVPDSPEDIMLRPGAWS